jgi:hypothetical protein
MPMPLVGVVRVSVPEGNTHKTWFLRPVRIPVPSQGRSTSDSTVVLCCRKSVFFLTALLGLEPKIPDPKSGVLPITPQSIIIQL